MAQQKFRDRFGKFTKFDKRKYIFDSLTAELIWSPLKINKKTLGFTSEKFFTSNLHIQFDKLNKVKVKKNKFGSRFIDTVTFSDRKNDEDLYEYFKGKEFNRYVAKLKKKYPNEVIVATVTTEIKGMRKKVESTEFKLTDFKPVTFKQSSVGRIGNKYKPADVLAYFTHKTINLSTDFSLYEYRTDIAIQVEKGQRKNQKKTRRKYGKEQSFKISFKTVSKRTSKDVSEIDPPKHLRERAKNRIKKHQRSRKRKVSKSS